MKTVIRKPNLHRFAVAPLLICAFTFILAADDPVSRDDGSVDSSESRLQQEIAGLEARLAELKPMIEHPRANEDPVLLVEEYMNTALQAVYFAKSLANSEGGLNISETQDLPSLVDSGYLAGWPENPADGWQPMRVLSPADGFSAGDLCVDYCPAPYYSDLGNGPEPVSFQLYVYGITPGQGSFQEVSVVGWNKKWAQVPSDVLYGMSFSASPVNDPQYKFELNPETGEYEPAG